MTVFPVHATSSQGRTPSKISNSGNSERLVDLEIETKLSTLGQTIQDEESFFVADLGQVIRQHSRWERNLPGVYPFYAVKCNRDPTLLRLLAKLGTGFDCASPEEIRSVISLGVEPSRIIFANPCKTVSALVFACEAGVTRTTFDNMDELEKIQKYLPKAELLLRIFANDSDALIPLGDKFGASIESSLPLLQRAKALGLNVSGVSFHVGTGAFNPDAYVGAIRHAKVVFEQGERVGYRMKVLDIGGGFQDSNFEKITFSLRRALMDFLPGTCVIAEPGRYYTRSAYTLACKIISRRVQLSGQVASTQPDMLYQNDGVYGNFMNVLIENEKLHPALVLGRRGAIRHQGKYRYSIWGPTCDSVDCVAREVTMDSEVLIGDWLKYKNMGAYTSATATQFNGFLNQNEVIYINSELDEIDTKLAVNTCSNHVHSSMAYEMPAAESYPV